MKIGEQITYLRKGRGLTQAQLGQMVGVSSQAVSKWESGGAPDVEMLPTIASALGVTVDTLFGLNETETENMTAVMARWLSTVPSRQRLTALYRVLVSTFGCTFFDFSFRAPDWQEDTNEKRIQETCFAGEGEETLWVRGGLANEEGLLLGVNGKNFPMYLLLPEPEGGYGENFASLAEYRSLFSALATPGALELLMCFLGRKRAMYSAGALTKFTAFPRAEVEGNLEKLKDCGVIQSSQIETEDGPMSVYTLSDGYGLVPLLYLARWVMDKSEFWSNSYFDRTSPVLKEVPHE